VLSPAFPGPASRRGSRRAATRSSSFPSGVRLATAARDRFGVGQRVELVLLRMRSGAKAASSSARCRNQSSRFDDGSSSRDDVAGRRRDCAAAAARPLSPDSE